MAAHCGGYRLHQISPDKSLKNKPKRQQKQTLEVVRRIKIQSCYNILPKMSNFQHKKKHAKKQKSVTHTQEEKQSIEIVSGTRERRWADVGLIRKKKQL